MRKIRLSINVIMPRTEANCKKPLSSALRMNQNAHKSSNTTRRKRINFANTVSSDELTPFVRGVATATPVIATSSLHWKLVCEQSMACGLLNDLRKAEEHIYAPQPSYSICLF